MSVVGPEYRLLRDSITSGIETGRALQVRCERWRGLVLRICIRPVNGAFVPLAIMDIRAHPISFCERP